MSEPWTYDCAKKLTEATECEQAALQAIHNQEPPWPDVDHWIGQAQARLHIARVDLAAARTAYARTLINAVVAKRPAEDDHEDDLLGEGEEIVSNSTDNG